MLLPGLCRQSELGSMVEEVKPAESIHRSGPRLATSDDIPRAVEFLINFVIRWTLFFFFALFGLLALAAWLRGWTWWVLVPALALALGSFLLACSFRPRGKLVFDRHGPMVMVGGQEPVDGEKLSSSP